MIDGVTIVPQLGEIQLGFINSLGQYEYREAMKDPKRAEAALKANPKWFAADGVYHGKGKISIFATATSANTRLTVVANSLLELKLNSGMGFHLVLTGVENVIQTIAHEYRGRVLQLTLIPQRPEGTTPRLRYTPPEEGNGLDRLQSTVGN